MVRCHGLTFLEACIATGLADRHLGRRAARLASGMIILGGYDRGGRTQAKIPVYHQEKVV